MNERKARLETEKEIIEYGTQKSNARKKLRVRKAKKRTVSYFSNCLAKFILCMYKPQHNFSYHSVS